MKQVIRKLFIDFEQEERWLNQMESRGLHFIDYTIGRYLFEEGKPGEYIYRIELLDNWHSHPESRAYIRFMEESGIECVSVYTRWVYFRKKASEGPFDLFSDCESRIAHYKRVLLLAGVVGGMNLVIGITGIQAGTYIPLINIGLACALTPLVLRLWRKVRKLQAEKLIHE